MVQGRTIEFSLKKPFDSVLSLAYAQEKSRAFGSAHPIWLRGRDFRVVPPKAELLALGSANVPSGTLAIARLSLRLCLASARSNPAANKK